MVGITAVAKGARAAAKAAPTGLQSLTEQALALANKRGDTVKHSRILEDMEKVDSGLLKSSEFKQSIVRFMDEASDPDKFEQIRRDKIGRIKQNQTLISGFREGRIPYMDREALKPSYLNTLAQKNAVDELLDASNQVRLYIEGHASPFKRATSNHEGWQATKIPEWLKDPDYQREWKGVDMQVVRMSPHQYLQQAARILSKQREVSPRELFEQRVRDGEPQIQALMEKMSRGTELDMPWLDFIGEGGQEGLHRAIAAERLGIPQIDVAVFKPFKKKAKTPEPAPDAPLPESPFDLEDTSTLPSYIARYKNNPTYFNREKNIKMETVDMSPEEYIKRAEDMLTKSWGKPTESRTVTGMEVINEYMEGMRAGKKFPAPYLSEIDNLQDGLHRAEAAKALGYDTIPVNVISDFKKRD